MNKCPFLLIFWGALQITLPIVAGVVVGLIVADSLGLDLSQ